MNCAECRENLVACLEGLLEPEQTRQCQAHLESCAACRAEYAATARLQKRLLASGRAAAEVSLVEPVMRQVRKLQTKQTEQTKKDSIMSKLLKHRWGFGLGAAAGAAAILLLIALGVPKAQATAAGIMAKGAKAVAKLTTIHLRGQLRTPPADNFGAITPREEFSPIELWKELGGEGKWRIDKPGRIALMDGHSTLLYIKPSNYAMKLPQRSRSAFDTEWLHRMADLSSTITAELANAKAKGWKLSLAEQQGPDGRQKAIVTVEAKSGLPDGDYLKNKFFDDSDTRRAYRFDATSELLEAVQVFLMEKSGEVLIFEITQIDYDQPIEQSLFQLELPANVNWHKDLEQLPDNEKYASMTAEQAARAFFEACGREDWAEVGKFWTNPLDERIRQFLGGLQLVNLGTAFGSKGYDPSGRFVPYEYKTRQGQVRKHNLALKKDQKTGRWFVDGGI